MTCPLLGRFFVELSHSGLDGVSCIIIIVSCIIIKKSVI